MERVDMKIKEIKENKKQFLPLLLLADEQEDMIDKYLSKGTMYVLDDDGIKCECVVTDEGNGILEIKNIATKPEAQGKGYGRILIEFIVEKYKELFNCDINSKQNNNDVNINILGEILKDFEFYIDYYAGNYKTISINFKNYIGLYSLKNDYCNFNLDNLLNYENYKYIFDKDFFENNIEKWYKNNIIKSKEMFPSNAITIKKDDLAERNLKKSILRQCFEMLY